VRAWFLRSDEHCRWSYTEQIEQCGGADGFLAAHGGFNLLPKGIGSKLSKFG
jgi:hypothetical protein